MKEELLCSLNYFYKVLTEMVRKFYVVVFATSFVRDLLRNWGNLEGALGETEIFCFYFVRDYYRAVLFSCR